MLWLLWMAWAWACADELANLPPYDNVVIVEEATPLLRWVNPAGRCRRGYDLSGEEPVLVAQSACAVVLGAGKAGPGQATERDIRRALEGKRSRRVRVIGDYRQLIVREIVTFPRPGPQGMLLATTGRVTYHLLPGATDLKVAHVHGGGGQLLCHPELPDRLGLGVEDPILVDWSPPPGWRGLPVIGVAGRGEHPELEPSMQALQAASLETLLRMDRGEELPRLSSFEPTPEPLNTEFGVAYTFRVSGHGMEPTQWTLEVPTSSLGRHYLRAARVFEPSGVHVEVEIRPDLQGTVTWTEPGGEPQLRALRVDVHGMRQGSSTILRGQPRLRSFQGIRYRKEGVWFSLDAGFSRLEYPVSEPVGLEIIRPGDPVDSVELAEHPLTVAKAIRFFPQHGHERIMLTEFGEETESFTATFDPRRQMEREIRIYAGQERPKKGTDPDILDRAPMRPFGAEGRLALQASDRLLTPDMELYYRGAWVVYRWLQEDPPRATSDPPTAATPQARVVAFRAFRVPPYYQDRRGGK